MGRRVRKFDGPSGRGLRIARWAILMKSALRDCRYGSYSLIRILLTGSLRSPPPIRAAPDFPLFRGQNKTPRNTLFISDSTVSTGYSAPACGGKVVAPATKGGNTGMVHEVYDSLFFSSDPSFPLEGKCHVVAKGWTGLSRDRTLFHFPDRQSAAPPERSGAQRTHFALANWICKGASAT